MRALLSYILTRILLTIPMILILLTLVFFIIRVMPGDPVKSMLGAHAPKATMEEIRHQLGLDKPIIDFSTNNQFVDYMSALLHGDFGMSLWYKVPVTKKITQYFPATLELSIFALMFAVVLGVATGAFAAHKRKSTADYAIRLFGITTYSIPVFWLGLMLQMFLGVGIGWFPSWFPIAGRIGARISPDVITGMYVLDGILSLNFEQVINALWHLALPASALGLILCGIFVRLTRANMLDVLKQDYVLAANARGIPKRRVVYRHALKNAFVPILTMMGLEFAYLMSGAVLTETTFSWPGMGSFLVESVNYRDFPALQGTIIFIALLVMGISLIVDILYAIIDPRVRY
jgi:peptide/nickel transport system permease protein